ncbi:glycoside hydrolase/deacetylase [Meredithblackwellia eburnea MCA 4105]
MLYSTLLLALAASASAIVKFEKRQNGNYPAPGTIGPTPLASWVTTYNAAKAAGKIPGDAPSTLKGGVPSYATGVNVGTGGVCSWTLSLCYGTFDVVDAPTGIAGISFDDGPVPASTQLYDYLQSQHQAATHFMIGTNILNNPGPFQHALQTGGHVAVHTWSHQYTTTLTDMQVLGELGWTAQIIFDQSGHVPAYWRPPYGDVDNRVRSIAREVFGMYTVIWNKDTNDWCLSDGGGTSCVGYGPGTDAGLDAELQGWWNGPKSPGIIGLEHEINSRTIGGFMRNYPTLLSRGWTPKCIPDIWNASWYNAGNTVGGGHGLPDNNGSNSTSAVSSGGVPSSAPPASRSLSATVTIVTPTSIGETVTAVAISTAGVSASASTVKTSATAHSSASRLLYPLGASSESWLAGLAGSLVVAVVAAVVV